LGQPAFYEGRSPLCRAFRYNLFIGEKPLKSISAAIPNAPLKQIDACEKTLLN